MTDRRWRRDPALLWRVTATAVVVQPRRSDETTVLAGTAAELWELLDTPCTVTELTAQLAERFVADRETIATDVAATLAELERRHVVHADG